MVYCEQFRQSIWTFNAAFGHEFVGIVVTCVVEGMFVIDGPGVGDESLDGVGEFVGVIVPDGVCVTDIDGFGVSIGVGDAAVVGI
jgi:hypothetical protein